VNAAAQTFNRASARQVWHATEIWVLISAWCSISGWALSACGCLNSKGYVAALVAGAVLLVVWGRKRWRGWRPNRPFFRHRRGALPFIFRLAALLALVGGALYTPNNYDALTYRFPRVLHWLAESRWHWIDTTNDRMNYSATGFEWLMTPLFISTHSDRLFFLINWLSYLLLPGLLFRFFRSAGIARRVAWHWMWLLPLGYCFILQAGSIGNDTFATVYFLAAVVFGRLAAQRRSIGDLWIALLSCALLTGAKVSNVPLVLPCVIAVWPALALIRRHIAGTVLTGIIAAIISFLPIAWFCHRNTGDWTGDPANSTKMKLDNPAIGIIGNTLQLIIQNASPAINPLTKPWNHFAAKNLETHPGQVLLHQYPRLSLQWGELATEETAGIGAGLLLLFTISCAAMLRHPVNGVGTRGSGFWITAAGVLALGVFMAKVGGEAVPRLVAAYNPVLFAFVLRHPANANLARVRWWRGLAIITAASALITIVLTPSRPLFPAVTLSHWAVSRFPENPLCQRVATVYSVYRQRAEVLAPIRDHLPAEAKSVGFIGGDDPQIALWRPFGSRRIVEITPQNQTEVLGADGVSYVVVSPGILQLVFGQSVQEWSEQHRAAMLARERIIVKVTRGAEDWLLFHIGKPAPSEAQRDKSLVQ
jgi:hypothetical protein